MPDTPVNQSSRVVAHVGLLIGGRYRLVHRIAGGGMADVWEATDVVLRRPVAVKILHPHLADDASFMVRFSAEAVAAARLHHPSIVTIYDTCHGDGLESIVMELVRGRTLRDYLDERTVLDHIEVAQIGDDVAAALDAAHRAGIVHRDVKPANILLCDDGRVLVTDFGIAKLRDDTDLTSTGTLLGSVKYLAPEQVEGGRVDARTDVYALGVVLYECLCGRPPFVGDSPTATALARLHRDPPPPRSLRSDLAPEMVALLDTCLARDPAGRFSSAAEMRDAISALPLDDDVRWADDTEPTVTLASPVPPTPGGSVGHPGHDSAPRTPPYRRSFTRPAMLAALVVAALVVAALLVWRARPTHDLVDNLTAPIDTSDPAPIPLRVVGVRTFDPQGTGAPGENDSDAHLAIDGLASTAWHTEGYSTRGFGNLKTGVGLYVTLDRAGPVNQVEVRSPTIGWSASVYRADHPADTLAGWGAPVATRTDIRGDANFDLHGASGPHVLIWITDLGNGTPPVSMAIAEISAVG